MLQRLDPSVAADAFLSIPFEDQQALFGQMPIGRVSPDARMQFIDKLPEEAGSGS
jgi:hypothetical protein